MGRTADLSILKVSTFFSEIVGKGQAYVSRKPGKGFVPEEPFVKM